MKTIFIPGVVIGLMLALLFLGRESVPEGEMLTFAVKFFSTAAWLSTTSFLLVDWIRGKERVESTQNKDAGAAVIIAIVIIAILSSVMAVGFVVGEMRPIYVAVLMVGSAVYMIAAALDMGSNNKVVATIIDVVNFAYWLLAMWAFYQLLVVICPPAWEKLTLIWSVL